MSEMVERVARKLTETLRHHGVEMHPDDIRGLAEDAIQTMREPTEGMLAAVEERCDEPYLPESVFAVMIDAALNERIPVDFIPIVEKE